VCYVTIAPVTIARNFSKLITTSTIIFWKNSKSNLEKFKINLGKIQNQAKKNEGKNCLQLPLF